MQPSITATAPYRMLVRSASVLPDADSARDLILVPLADVIERWERPRESVWIEARTAAQRLIEMRSLDGPPFSQAVLAFVEKFGLLFGGLNYCPRPGVPIYGGLLATLLEHEVALDCGDKIAEIESFRQIEERSRAAGLEHVTQDLRYRVTDPGSWELWDLSDARQAEMRQGPSWSDFRGLFAQLRYVLELSTFIGNASDSTPVIEPVAIYRLAARVVADLSVADKPFHEIEASLQVARAILKSHVGLIPVTRSQPLSPLPLQLQFQCWTWLSAIVLAAIAEGPIDVRSCAYRNCVKSFPVERADKRYCSERCGKDEAVYRRRERDRAARRRPPV
jgi:hypothetical protein